MISAVVEAVLGPEILRERRDAGQTFVDQLRLAQGPAAGFETLRHLAAFGAEVTVLPQHPFRQREHVDLQVEQILDRVVVLKPIHSPNRRLRQNLLGRDGDMQQSAQLGDEFPPLLGRQRRLSRWRHDSQVERPHQIVDQLGIPGEIRSAAQLEQIDIPAGLAELAVAMNAAFAQNLEEHLGPREIRR